MPGTLNPKLLPRFFRVCFALGIAFLPACQSESKSSERPAKEAGTVKEGGARKELTQKQPETSDVTLTGRVEGSDKSEHAALANSSARATTPPVDGPRVYAKTRHVWIRSMPTSDVQWIGYLWWGGNVKTRAEKPVPGAGCSKEWVAVEPRGWVCVDDKQATLNPKDPELLAIYPYRPRLDTDFPHKYAAVHEAVRRYDELPSEEQQSAWELGYEEQIAYVRKARTGSLEGLPERLKAILDPSLSGNSAPQLGALPDGLSEHLAKIAPRSAVSYVTEADHGDRSFLLTGDLAWIPKDRVELLSPSSFSGVELGKKYKLPLAFFRGKKRPAFRKTGEDSFDPVPDYFERLAVVQLENQVTSQGRTKFYKVAGQDLWVSDREAVIPVPRDKTPWGAPLNQPDTTGLARPGRATWVEASILGGWLVAFEGTRPAYATMISAGRGGTPVNGKDPLETASTPTGWFPIGGKFRTATMLSSSTPIVHMDVPWTQNFSGPHAIHSAYWHDDWGNLKSAGCVNLSPKDGKWLFGFTEPTVPEGWHGVRYVARYGDGSTLFLVHE